MGGQYAAALGFALADRITRVAIVAGAVPLTEPGAFARFPAMDRTFTRLSQRAPLVARAVFRSMGAIALRFPRLWAGSPLPAWVVPTSGCSGASRRATTRS